jgi:hypothetical protein
VLEQSFNLYKNEKEYKIIISRSGANRFVWLRRFSGQTAFNTIE